MLKCQIVCKYEDRLGSIIIKSATIEINIAFKSISNRSDKVYNLFKFNIYETKNKTQTHPNNKYQEDM